MTRSLSKAEIGGHLKSHLHLFGNILGAMAGVQNVLAVIKIGGETITNIRHKKALLSMKRDASVFGGPTALILLN